MDRPSGFLSVMADRAPAADGELDYFPTPPWAARAGGALIRELDPAAVSCWEPACGAGHMAFALADYFAEVFASDIEPRGWGAQLDFLGEAASAPELKRFDWIVTNPPFIDGAAFVRAGLKRARRGVAMLLRLQFIGTGHGPSGRHTLFYGDTPLSVMAPFAERPAMFKGRWVPDGSTATDYAWFVWLKRGLSDPDVSGPPRLMPIPPGTKAKLTRQADFDRFGPPGEATGQLFGGDGA